MLAGGAVHAFRPKALQFIHSGLKGRVNRRTLAYEIRHLQ